MNHDKTETDQTQKKRYTIWIGTILFVGSVLLFILSIREFNSLGAIGKNTVFVLESMLILSSLSCILLSRFGLHRLGIIQLSLVILANSIGNVFLISGIGLALGITSALIIFLFSVTILSGKSVTWMSFIGIIGGIATILIDAFYTGARFTPGLTRYIPYLLAILSIGFIWALRSQILNMSLRSKLVLSFVSITLVSVLVLSIINNVFTSKSLTTTAGEIAQTLADAQAREVSSIIESQVNLLSALTLDELLLSTLQTTNQTYTGTPETIRAEIQELDKVWIAADQAANTQEPLILDRLNNLAAGHLVEYNLRFPANVELIATDKYGAIAGAYTFSSNTNVRGHPSDYDQSDESWWQSAYNQGLGDIFIGEPEFDDSVGSLTIILAMPVRKPGTGEVLGVLRTTLSLNLLSQITKIYIGDTGLFDIYFPGETTHQLALGDYKTVDPTDLAVISSIGDEPFIIGQYKGNSSLISQSAVISAVKAITRLGWTVVYHQHEEEALRPITLQTKNNTVLAIIVAIVVGVMTSIIAQAISRPIMELTSSVQLVAKGDLTVRAAERGQDEIGVLSRAFNSMTEQLRNIINTLEQRVVERTRAIETSAEVSRRLSTILDQKQLVFAVVEEIQSSFEFYHTQIYLYDEAREFLIMVGGTGEAGQTMLMRGHKIARGRGLVGRAAESNTVVLVSDTSSDSNWLPNPLLPETRSEVAVPIAVGEQVLGVLDVQHTIVGGLEEQNVALLKSIANQIAIAVQNARLYSEAQEQAEKEELIFNISQKIQIATSIEHVLETAARELGQALGSPKVTVQLSNPAKIKGNGK